MRRQKPKIQLGCQIDGGGHENGLRSGTLNVPGIVGLGKAAEICAREMPDEGAASRGAARSPARRACAPTSTACTSTARLTHRLPHNLHVSFDGVDGEGLLMALGDLAVSTGSACSSGSQAPSHVLQAIGAVGEGAGAVVRFGLGRGTTEPHIQFAIDRLSAVVSSLRRSAVAH